MAPSSTGQAIGAALAVASSIISNLGVNVQKYSHNEDEARHPSQRTAYLWRPLWWFGLFLIIAGSLGDFAALGFAPQALVAALGGGSTLVANVFLAHFFNGERIFVTDLVGVAFVTGGVVLVALISKPDEPLALSELEKRFTRPGFVYYIAILLLSTIALLTTISGSAANRMKKYLLETTFSHRKHIKRLETRLRLLEARLLLLERETSKRPTPLNEEGGEEDEDLDWLIRMELLEARELAFEAMKKSQDHVPYLYAAVAGVVGATSVLLAKISAMLVAKTLEGENQFNHPLSYAFLLAMIGTVLTQTHLLNQAMALGDGMTVYPVFQAFWISFSVIGGIVFYEASREFSASDWVLYPFSLLLVILGILFLFRHKDKAGAEEEASLADPSRYGLLWRIASREKQLEKLGRGKELHVIGSNLDILRAGEEEVVAELKESLLNGETG